MTEKAKRIKILDMLAGYPSLIGADLRALTSAMSESVAEYGLEAVTLACARFLRGEVVGRNNAFPPTAAEFAIEARDIEQRKARRNPATDMITYPLGELPPPGYIALGPLESQINGRMVDMRHMHPREKEKLLAGEGLPPPHKKLPRDVIKPRLQRMTGNG